MALGIIFRCFRDPTARVNDNEARISDRDRVETRPRMKQDADQINAQSVKQSMRDAMQMNHHEAGTNINRLIDEANSIPDQDERAKALREIRRPLGDYLAQQKEGFSPTPPRLHAPTYTNRLREIHERNIAYAVHEVKQIENATIEMAWHGVEPISRTPSMG